MHEHSTANLDLVTFVSSLSHKNERCCRPHFHQNMEIVYNISGIGVTHLTDNSAFSLTPGTVIVYWPMMTHDQMMEKIGDDICILLSLPDTEWLPKDKKWLKVNLEDNSFLRREILNLEKVPLRRTRIQQQAADLRSTALLLDLITLASEAEKAENSNTKLSNQIIKAHNYIRDNFSSIFSVRDVADELCISYDYLRHQFREAYGMSLKQYLLNVRMDQAAQFLEYSPLSMKHIAQECGFDNVRYFSTSFKRHTGLTPGEYRKQHSKSHF